MSNVWLGIGLVAGGLLLVAIGAKIIEEWLKDVEKKAQLIETVGYQTL